MATSSLSAKLALVKITLLGLPLGNIEDISLRAIKTLSIAQTIICEDTRVFHKLWQKLINLGHLSQPFTGRLHVLNDFNEATKTGWLLDQLGEQTEAVLVSDAGMPIISDPGFRLVNEVLARGGHLEVIPGPTAATTALVASGFSADRVLFLGFLPKKQNKRRANWDLIKAADGLTVVLYESPLRVVTTLAEIEVEFGPSTLVVIARELTKEHEQIIRGQVEWVRKEIGQLKGEVVLLFRSNTPNHQKPIPA